MITINKPAIYVINLICFCMLISTQVSCVKNQENNRANVKQVVGEENFIDAIFLKLGAEKAKAVGLIAGKATGFLINDDLMMTNWHMLPSIEAAKGYKEILFGMEKMGDGLPSNSNIKRYELNPDKFFYTNEDLDFSVVAVNGNPAKELGFINIFNPVILELATHANIIQYPGGGLKKIVIRDNKIKSFDDKIIRYYSDTLHGSSGSPVFDDNWNIIALHYRANSEIDSTELFNEGHNINAIASDLKLKFPEKFANK